MTYPASDPDKLTSGDTTTAVIDCSSLTKIDRALLYALSLDGFASPVGHEDSIARGLVKVIEDYRGLRLVLTDAGGALARAYLRETRDRAHKWIVERRGMTKAL